MTEVLGPVVGSSRNSQAAPERPEVDTYGLGPSLRSGDVLRAPVLVLNLNYVPINVCSVRRAIVLVGKGKAELLQNHRGQIHTVSCVFDIPSIIRLDFLIKRPFAPRKLSKREVFLRDRFTCQYCERKTQDLTLDHVVPRRQWGKHSWENVVAACSGCNLRKAGRTPEEANMRLIRAPRAPQPDPYRILKNLTILEEWRPYIPWTTP